MMFSEKEILLMIGVVGILLFIITILTIFDIIDFAKKKKKNNVEELEETSSKEIVKSEDPIEVKDNILEEESLEPIKTQDEIQMVEVEDEIVINDISLQNEPIIEELEEPLFVKKNQEPLIEEEKVSVIKVDDYTEKANTVKVNLEEELNKALDTIPIDTDAISKFEEEQERTAIISLDELMKKSDDLYNINEISQYDDGNEPISIDEVINRYGINDEKTVPDVMQDIVDDRKAYSHKESIPFISSVYGLDKDSKLEFENTATYEKLSREKNSEFMSRFREINEKTN